MPNVSQMLKSLAREQGVDLEIVQKNYAISYLLAAIAQTVGLGEKIVLKGGTALKKLYYPTYSFSEDLDYSTLKLGVFTKGDELLRIAVTRMAGSLQERGPFNVQVEPLPCICPIPENKWRIRFGSASRTSARRCAG